MKNKLKISENEKIARIVIRNAIQLNITILMAKNILNKNIKLTDNECINIAKNYPYSWEDIRIVFPL